MIFYSIYNYCPESLCDVFKLKRIHLGFYYKTTTVKKKLKTKQPKNPQKKNLMPKQYYT